MTETGLGAVLDVRPTAAAASPASARPNRAYLGFLIIVELLRMLPSHFILHRRWLFLHLHLLSSMRCAVIHGSGPNAKKQPETHWVGTVDRVEVLWFPIERDGRSHAGMVDATWSQFMDSANRQLS